MNPSTIPKIIAAAAAIASLAILSACIPSEGYDPRHPDRDRHEDRRDDRPDHDDHHAR